jgi:transcriptional regulator with XRE-family HTH domain
MTSTLRERLSAARHKCGFTQAELAQRAGVSQSTIAQIESGRNSGTKFAFRLANALQVSVEWLLVGKGIMEMPTIEEIDAAYAFSSLRDGVSINLTEPRADPDDPQTVAFDFVLPGAAMFDKSFFEHHGVTAYDCRLIAVNGSDLEPYLFSGDWVMINVASTTLRDGEIYAFWFAGGNCVIRQVAWLPDGGLRLKTFRHPVEFYDVPASQVEPLFILGKVIYRSAPQVFDDGLRKKL